ncbi:MAG TPA: hypothetical protein VFT16_06010 [Candidatus Saccharimonadales bacterium]|nr:hypothetical protein [Candidatus Saccharimonadales bacterium]
MAWLAVLSAVVGLIGYVPYVRDLCRPSDTKPDPILWGIWALEYTSLVAAQAHEAAGLALFLPASQLAGVAIVLALSLRRGALSITRQKVLLLVCVLAALSWWWLASSAVVAILLLIAVENSAVVATIFKVWEEPHSENLAMWGSACAAGFMGTLALGFEAQIVLYAYPASLALMTGTVTGVALARRRSLVATGA